MKPKLPVCIICRQPNRARLIEADWADGMSAVGISKTMTDTGWQVSSATILKHLKEHADEGARTRQPVNLGKRDAAVFVKRRIMQRIEELERDDSQRQALVKQADGSYELETIPFDILDKDLQPALGSMLKAEAIIVKKEQGAARQQTGLLVLMLGMTPDGLGVGPLAPLELTAGEDNDDIIDGEAVEVDDAQAD